MLPPDQPAIFSWAETTECVSQLLLTQSVSHRVTLCALLPRERTGWRGSLKGKLWQMEPRHSLLFANCFSPCLTQGDLVAVGVLSGNRNFEGRVHPNTRANYLASPPLVIAYAIAGTIRIDFEKEPLGKIFSGGLQFFQCIWKHYWEKVIAFLNK